MSDLRQALQEKELLPLFADDKEQTLGWDGRPDPNGVRVFVKDGRLYVHCLKRKRDLRYKPEELVRQHALRKLVEDLHYDVAQISVEEPITMGSAVHDKPADIVVFTDSRRTVPRIVVETKKPTRRDGLEQLKSYMNANGAQFGWWTNGSDEHFLLRSEPNTFSLRLTRLPGPGEGLDDIDSPLTKGELQPIADLLDLIRLCEQEILAHQTVNTFDELFKVLFAKLYDERMNLGKPTDVCEFRIGLTETATNAATRVRGLYKKARKKWRGVFKDEDIELTDDNLAYVISALQEYEFLSDGSGDVLGVAFEAMINPETKGDRGQYFTPRHVIDMCVRMLSPRMEEKVCDPACGSAGFLIRTMKHVYGFIDSKWVDLDQRIEHRKDYAQSQLVGIDNDPRLVRIAKAYMIIENDGRSNIFFADALDPASWSSELKSALTDVDLILTNPPFAGAIKTIQTLNQYDLAYKGDPGNNRRAKSVTRAILFLERCLEVLRPGGRMAIVLPQGLLNNVNDEYVRSFIDRRARIVAVVDLHENTFKPFTTPRTSVLFLQKWREEDDREADYKVFVDVSTRPGKDRRGAPVYLPDGTLDTDVYEIADAFREWAKDQEFDWL